MRVLTLTNMYPTPADPTYGTFVGDQVSALRLHPLVQRCDVLFIDGRANRLNYLRAPFQLASALRRHPVDVVHAHYGLTGAVATAQQRVPSVVTYHTGDLELTAWQRKVSRLAYRRAAANVCVSRRAMRELPGPALHLTCGIDRTLFTPRDRNAARGAFGVQPGELAILFPSSPDRPKKAYPRFAEVVAELRRRGHRIKELQLRGLRREQVPELMAAADVMVMTSTQEGTPVAVMEALACGLPVVATPVGDVADMLADAQAARVLQFETMRFADTVLELADQERDRAPDPASQRFAEEDITDRLARILADVAAGRPVRCA